MRGDEFKDLLIFGAEVEAGRNLVPAEHTHSTSSITR